MDAKVSSLVQTYSAPKKDAVSGIPYEVFTKNRQKFKCNPTRIGDFWTEYCSLVLEDEAAEDNAEDPSIHGLPIGEVAINHIIPICVSLMFRFDLDKDDRIDPVLYSEIFLLHTTYSIQELFAEELQLSKETGEMWCCILESKPWQKGEETCIEVRFHFPYACVDIKWQKNNLKNLLAKKFRSNKIMDHLEHQPIGDWNSIIEDFDGTIPMYGSKRHQERCTPRFSSLVEKIDETQLDLKRLPTKPLDTIFAPIEHNFINNQVKNTEFLERDTELNFWLPLFLSIHFFGSVTHPKGAYVEEEKEEEGEIQNIYEVSEEEKGSKEPLIIAKQLLPLLKIHRFNAEPYWMDIGRALYNITDGGDEGLELWIHYSSQSKVEGRDAKSCESQYYKLRDSPVSHRTIAWYAKEDSKERYEAWHQEWIESIIGGNFEASHEDIAEVLWRTFWLEYMCVGMTKNCWYQFRKTYLKHIDSAVSLRQDLSEKFIPMFYKIQEGVMIKRAAAQSELSEVGEGKRKVKNEVTSSKKEVVEKHNSMIDMLGSVIRKLKNQGFRSSVINMAMEKFYIEDFEKYKDKNPATTAWKNCVIECCGDTAFARPGKPEDYITMNTGVEYKQLPDDDPRIKTLLTWFSQMFPDEQLLRYVMKDLASILYGRNSEKLFRVWSGEGDNSKSMLVKLLQVTLGSYCIDFPVEMLVASMNKGSGPSPELAQARGAHVGIIAEPDSNQKLEKGKVKRYTGMDRFFARMCNENGGSMEASFKLFYMCNQIPEIADPDKAVYNRFTYTPFLSTWSVDAPEDIAEQFATKTFKMDPRFEDKIPDLAPAFATLLVKWYPIYCAEGMKKPPIVIQHINEYWDANDPYRMFVNEYLENAVLENGNFDPTATLTHSDIFNVYKNWFMDQFGSGSKDKLPNAPTFKGAMSQKHRLGKQHNGRWIGWRLKLVEAAVPGFD